MAFAFQALIKILRLGVIARSVPFFSLWLGEVIHSLGVEEEGVLCLRLSSVLVSVDCALVTLTCCCNRQSRLVHNGDVSRKALSLKALAFNHVSVRCVFSCRLAVSDYAHDVAWFGVDSLCRWVRSL